MKYAEKQLMGDLCEKCPARKDSIFAARLRGSSFRGRQIEKTEEYTVDNVVILVGSLTVANVQIANHDQSAAEHDSDFIRAVFEQEVSACTRPDLVLTGDGMQSFCAPINKATDKFIETNYEG